MKDLQKKVWNTYCIKGWSDIKKTPVEELALIHSEVSEALEAYRINGTEDWVENNKWEGYFVELADVVTRVMNVFSENNKDLGEYVEKKDGYNRTRPKHHGGKRL